MTTYTHVFRESGNGFPRVGEAVLVEGDCGGHSIMRVVETSPIHTRQWAANWMYLTLGPADREWDDLTEMEQDAAWEGLCHVEPASAEDAAA